MSSLLRLSRTFRSVHTFLRICRLSRWGKGLGLTSRPGGVATVVNHATYSASLILMTGRGFRANSFARKNCMCFAASPPSLIRVSKDFLFWTSLLTGSGTNAHAEMAAVRRVLNIPESLHDHARGSSRSAMIVCLCTEGRVVRWMVKGGRVVRGTHIYIRR